MRRTVLHLTVLFAGVLSSMGVATGSCAEEPHGARVFTADLGRGGAACTIATRKFATTDAGDYFQLVVTDAAGRTLWAGPRRPDESNALVFGAWHHGVSLPECVGDIDADGSIELVAPAPQSDVSPVLFRVLRWNGAAFSPVRSGTLLEDPVGSGHYPWARSDSSHGRWVSHFRTATRGSLIAEIVDYAGGDAVRMGTARMSPRAGGYRVVAWLQPMSIPGER